MNENKSNEERYREEFEKRYITSPHIYLDRYKLWEGGFGEYTRREVQNSWECYISGRKAGEDEISQLKAENERLKLIQSDLYKFLLPVYESQMLRDEEFSDEEWFDDLGKCLDISNKLLNGFDFGDYFNFKGENQQLKDLVREAKEWIWKCLEVPAFDRYRNSLRQWIKKSDEILK